MFTQNVKIGPVYLTQVSELCTKKTKTKNKNKKTKKKQQQQHKNKAIFRIWDRFRYNWFKYF